MDVDGKFNVSGLKNGIVAKPDPRYAAYSPRRERGGGWGVNSFHLTAKKQTWCPTYLNGRPGELPYITRSYIQMLDDLLAIVLSHCDRRLRISPE